MQVGGKILPVRVKNINWSILNTYGQPKNTTPESVKNEKTLTMSATALVDVAILANQIIVTNITPAQRVHVIVLRVFDV